MSIDETEEYAPLPDVKPAEVEEPEKAETEQDPEKASEASTEDEAPETSAADDQSAEPDDSAEKAPKKKGSPQKRINTLTRQKYELQRRVAELEARTESQPVASEAPKADDFTNHDDYVVAKAKFEFGKEEAARAEKQAFADQQAQAQASAAVYLERLEDAREKYDDFDDVVMGSEVPISHVMETAIVGSEVGPDVTYWLGKHPEEARRITGLSEIDQVREIGRLEARVTAPKPRKSTKAPDPIEPLKGGETPVASLADAKSFAEYRKMRQGSEKTG
jgi:hypothetical protein